MKIYIVEDSPVMVERIIARLSTIPFIEIAGISDSEEKAFADIRRLRPEFLIIDIMSKEWNGIDFLKRIKEELPEINVSTLDYSTKDLFIKNMFLGADVYSATPKNSDNIAYAVNVPGLSSSRRNRTRPGNS